MTAIKDFNACSLNYLKAVKELKSADIAKLANMSANKSDAESDTTHPSEAVNNVLVAKRNLEIEKNNLDTIEQSYQEILEPKLLDSVVVSANGSNFNKRVSLQTIAKEQLIFLRENKLCSETTLTLAIERTTDDLPESEESKVHSKTSPQGRPLSRQGSPQTFNLDPLHSAGTVGTPSNGRRLTTASSGLEEDEGKPPNRDFSIQGTALNESFDVRESDLLAVVNQDHTSPVASTNDGAHLRESPINYPSEPRLNKGNTGTSSPLTNSLLSSSQKRVLGNTTPSRSSPRNGVLVLGNDRDTFNSLLTKKDGDSMNEGEKKLYDMVNQSPSGFSLEPEATSKKNQSEDPEFPGGMTSTMHRKETAKPGDLEEALRGFSIPEE